VMRFLLDWFVKLGVCGMGHWPVVLEDWVGQGLAWK
jgi:hypothetical protein